MPAPTEQEIAKKKRDYERLLKKLDDHGRMRENLAISSYLTERKLRPLPMIGWNIDKGGYGGKYLTYFNNINCKRTYYNMLSRAKEYGVMVAEELVKS